MDLSNLSPAAGSKHSDNFRRGRGHGSGNGKTAGKGLPEFQHYYWRLLLKISPVLSIESSC